MAEVLQAVGGEEGASVYVLLVERVFQVGDGAFEVTVEAGYCAKEAGTGEV
jgi:hypothetical protein